MKNLKEIKNILGCLIGTSAEAKTKSPPLWKEGRTHYRVELPLLSILAIPWKAWPKGTGIPELKRMLLGWRENSITVQIPIRNEKSPQRGIQQALQAVTGERPTETPSEEKTKVTWETLCRESLLLPPEKEKLLPSSSKRSIKKYSGTWTAFAEYFEGNREGGWKTINTDTRGKKQQNNYVPPLILHVDLSLLDGKNPNFQEAGLPTETEWTSLFKGISSKRNRMVSLMVHGKESIVELFQKTLQEAASHLKNRYNIRWLNPTTIKLESGKIRVRNQEHFDAEAAEKVLQELPKWEKYKKELSSLQEECLQAIIQYQQVEWTILTLRKLAENANLKLACKELETYTKFPQLEFLQEEKRREESAGWAYQKPNLIKALKDEKNTDWLKAWHKLYQQAETIEFKAKARWRTEEFQAPYHLRYSEKAQVLWPNCTEGWRRHRTKLLSPTTEDIETETGKTLVREILQSENPFHQIEDLLNGSPSIAQEEFNTWKEAVKKNLQEKGAKTLQEVSQLIEVAKKNLSTEETVIKVLYLYGEISDRPPSPATVETKEFLVSKKRDLTPEVWEEIATALGEGHAPLLTCQIPGANNTVCLGLKTPDIPEEYVEPSTLPTIPEGLRRGRLHQNITQTLNGEKNTTKREIKLNIRLKPKMDPITELYLDIDNRQISLFNPVIGKPTGLKDTLLWRPVITKQGIQWVENALKTFAYKLEASNAVHNFAERKVRKGERVLAPNYALTQYEMMAYYSNAEQTAQVTIINPDTGEPLWTAGKPYQITPSWDREQILVDNFNETEEVCSEETTDINPDLTVLGDQRTKIQGAEQIERLNQVSINYGFATFLVHANDGRVHKIKETVNRENYSVEKERIAEEIQTLLERIEEITKTYALTKQAAYLQKEANPENARPVITPGVQRELTTLKDRVKELEETLERWAPNIDDFLEAFPPEAPPLATQMFEEDLRRISKSIMKRFAPFMRSDLSPSTVEANKPPHCTIKNYQLRNAALMALKRSSGNSGHPGSGKTLMSIMASYEMGHHYNLIIAPTIALNSWAKELEKVGLYHEVIGYRKGKDDIWRPNNSAYQDIRKITARLHRRERCTNRTGKIEPEYYIVSAETLSLGGEGNLRFNPWHYDYPINKATAQKLKDIEIPPHWSYVEKPIARYKIKDFDNPRIETIDNQDVHFAKHLRIWSDQADNSHELQKYGAKGIFKSISFRRAIRQCPNCGTDGENWTLKGNCKNCGHHHTAVTRVKAGWEEKETHHPAKTLIAKGLALTGSLPKNTPWSGEKISNNQFPGYKLLRKHFGLKIIDEIHNFSSFNSQHGNALLQVKTKDTIVLSGTLCRTHITELEPSLCHIYEPNSGEFPYTPWGMELFKEQFSTYEVRSTTEIRRQEARRKKTTTRVPEASNLTKLRSLMHGVIIGVSEKEMAKEWNLRPINENIQYVELQRENAALYEEWQQKIQDAYAACQTEKEKTNMLQQGRKMLTHLAYACDGPEKLAATIAWIREGLAQNKRMVVVGPSTRFYTLLHQELKTQKINFMGIGSMPSEKRFEVLNKFRNSGCPLLISRIRLINVNFNQLTCCQKILFTGVDPSPAAIRQMQQRLNRPGQTEDVSCTFLITRGLQARNTHVIQNRPTINLEQTIAQTLGEPIPTANEEPSPTPRETPRRLPSYEERLFATVLRREKAIQAVLNQADKQRDPQELYNMIQERQTLNEVLRDIATEATTDLSLLESIQKTDDILQAGIPTPEKVQPILPQPEKTEEKPKGTAKKEKPQQLNFNF